MAEQSRYLTLPEAAEIARATVSTVRWWIATSKLRASRPGRRVLVRRDTLFAFLDGAPLDEPTAPLAPTNTRESIEASRAARRLRRRAARGGVAPDDGDAA